MISLCVCMCMCARVCGWGSVEPQNSLDLCQNVWWPRLVSDSTDVVSSAERLQSRVLMGKTWVLQRNKGERTIDTQKNLPTLCSSAKKKNKKQTNKQKSKKPKRGKQIQVWHAKVHLIFSGLCGFPVGSWPTQVFLLQKPDVACLADKQNWTFRASDDSGTNRFYWYVCCR